MDNEFKRRLIRHLENVKRLYEISIERWHGHKLYGPDIPDPAVLADKTEALDDCVRLLALLRRGG